MSYQSDFLAYRAPKHVLTGRVIVITGAGAGIGKSVALACAVAGATVVLLGRTMLKLEATYDAIEQMGGPQPAIFPINFDSASAQDYQQLNEALAKEFGRIDGLLHNAAIVGQQTSIEQYSAVEWQRVMQVNVTAPFMLTQSLLPILKKSADASVVFTGASVGYHGHAYWGAYGASKAAAENLMQTLAEEHSIGNGLRFNSINPGATRTAMRSATYPGESPSEATAPEDHANQYLFLLGPASTGINGKQFQAQPKK
jgi:NAD(P)-dependent dehydrogenase (short-subunit alcohol dehydrogenase family)